MKKKQVGIAIVAVIGYVLASLMLPTILIVSLLLCGEKCVINSIQNVESSLVDACGVEANTIVGRTSIAKGKKLYLYSKLVKNTIKKDKGLFISIDNYETVSIDDNIFVLARYKGNNSYALVKINYKTLECTVVNYYTGRTTRIFPGKGFFIVFCDGIYEVHDSLGLLMDTEINQKNYSRGENCFYFNEGDGNYIVYDYDFNRYEINIGDAKSVLKVYGNYLFYYDSALHNSKCIDLTTNEFLSEDMAQELYNAYWPFEINYTFFSMHTSWGNSEEEKYNVTIDSLRNYNDAVKLIEDHYNITCDISSYAVHGDDVYLFVESEGIALNHYCLIYRLDSDNNLSYVGALDSTSTNIVSIIIGE